MALTHQGFPTSVDTIMRAHKPAEGHGFPAGVMRDFARGRGAEAYLVHGRLDDLESELSLNRPVIVGVVRRMAGKTMPHYVVVVGLEKRRALVATIDPAGGLREVKLTDFQREWEPSRQLMLVLSARQVE
jgi:hypothetical protein